MTLVWNDYVDSVEVHRACTELGSIEIRDEGESVTRGDKTWTLFQWKVKGDGFQVTGVARSLGRAKEDAMAALEMLSGRDFDRPSPRDEPKCSKCGDTGWAKCDDKYAPEPPHYIDTVPCDCSRGCALVDILRSAQVTQKGSR